MDFVEGPPKFHHKNAILVVVGRFSKYGHFIGLTHPFTDKDIAHLFFDNIHKLNGMPHAIVSDRDAIFLSQFRTRLFKKFGTQLCHSTAYHPQTDGQTKRLN